MGDLRGALPSGRPGAFSDGRHGQTLSPHVPVQSHPTKEAPGIITSANKLEVQVPPHMAEGHVGVLVNNSTVRTEGNLPALPFEVERLPHRHW